MSQPTRSQVRVNKPLTDVSLDYAQSLTNFAFARMLPAVPVDKKSDLYYVFSKNKRDDMKPRAPGTPAAVGGFNVSTDAYLCQRYDEAFDIPDAIRGDSDFDMDEVTTKQLTEKAYIRLERIFAQNFMSTGVWGIDYTGIASGTPTATQFIIWSDPVNSTPAADVQKAMTAVHLKSGGLRPNKICLAQDVADVLVNHPDVIARVNAGQTTGVATVTYADLAKYFRVDEVVVSGAVYDASNEGGTEDMTFVAAGKVLLMYVTRTPGLMVPNAGYRFNNRTFGGNGDGIRIKKFHMDELEADRIEAAVDTDMKVVGADLGCLFSSVLAV